MGPWVTPMSPVDVCGFSELSQCQTLVRIRSSYFQFLDLGCMQETDLVVFQRECW